MQTRAFVIFALCSTCATLRLWSAENTAPQLGSSAESSAETSVPKEIPALQAALKKASSPNRCGVVLGAFGDQSYIKLGDTVSQYIRGIEVPPGWCPAQPELSHLPVALFTDAKNHVCPLGVECFSEKNMAPWTVTQADIRNNKGASNHLGGWRVRFYHAQMIASSPYDLTLYLDLDAVPCNGEGIQGMFSVMKNSTLGSISHTSNPCGAAPTHREGQHDCNVHPPPDMAKEERAGWNHFVERNGGVIITDLRKTRPIFETWAKYIRMSATSKLPALGDQHAYRQALFKHKDELTTEHEFSRHEVCRSLPKSQANCHKGCFVFHKPEMASLQAAGLIGETAARTATAEAIASAEKHAGDESPTAAVENNKRLRQSLGQLAKKDEVLAKILSSSKWFTDEKVPEAADLRALFNKLPEKADPLVAAAIEKIKAEPKP